MKKNGFTLVEVMVVIVVMGVLAAVGVPKVFTLIAKAKAAEVAPAAATYIKLQNVYANQNQTFGGWNLIGYAGPGKLNSDGDESETDNFIYGSAYQANYKVPTRQLRNMLDELWTAKSKLPLNDCPQGNLWTIDAFYNKETKSVEVFASVENESVCQPLTLSFSLLSTMKERRPYVPPSAN